MASNQQKELHRRAEAASQLASQRLVRLQAALQAANVTRAKVLGYKKQTPGAQVVELRSLVESLRERLASQPIIEQAKGMIMASSHCDEDVAFDILRRASQRANVKLREVARQVVMSNTAPAASYRPDPA
jgi:LmbE family N-acetylglucosaminyl deacetylase